MTDDASPLVRPIRPAPGLLRTIGVLNLLIGTALLVCGGGYLWGVTRFMAEFAPLQLEPENTRAVLEQMRLQLVKDLEADAAAASAPADRDRLKKEAADLAGKPVDIAGKLDFAAINHDLPALGHYLWADSASAPVLNVLLLFSAIGLLLVKNWGRRLALVVAGLKVIRLLGLTGFLALMVVPQVARVAEQFAGVDVVKSQIALALAKQNAQRSAAGAPPAPQLGPADVVRLMQAFGYGYAVLSLGIGLIYPVVILIVLTRPGARAACQRCTPAADDVLPSPQPAPAQ